MLIERLVSRRIHTVFVYFVLGAQNANLPLMTKSKYLGLAFMGSGVALGPALGLAFGNLAIGMGVGVALGIGVGTVIAAAGWRKGWERTPRSFVAPGLAGVSPEQW